MKLARENIDIKNRVEVIVNKIKASSDVELLNVIETLEQCLK